MLAELRAISNKSSASRFEDFEKKVVKTTVSAESSNGVAFLQGNPEDPALNQYWYSQNTIDALTNECERLIDSRGPDFRVAFLSTPSVYFALSEKSRTQCFCMDYDKKWADDRGFVFYDFNAPATFDDGSLLSSFDMVVIDPPFITREVWEKYTESAIALLKEKPAFGAASGVVLGTTVAEVSLVTCHEAVNKTIYLYLSRSLPLFLQNAPFMEELLGCKPQSFKPSIPNLVYQYNSYANFDGCAFLSQVNPEIPE